MNTILTIAEDLVELSASVEDNGLKFVEDASYEFVGGGTAVNGW
jgi:hypothetical protein